MKIATLYSPYSNKFRLRLEIFLDSQNIANNSSVVSWAMYLEVGTTYFNSYTLSNSLTWIDLENDGTKEWTWPYPDQFSCGGTNRSVIVKSGSKTILHSADGTKTINVTGSFRTNTVTSITPSTALVVPATGVTLTTIPRTSVPTLSNNSPVMGTQITITTNRASTSFTHTLKYQFGTLTDTTTTGVTTSHTWTVPLSFANAIPNAESGTGTITCETYNGATLIGTKTINFTATVPTNVIPTITTPTIVEAMTGYATKFGALINTKSKLSVTITSATGAYSSTIKSFNIVANGETFNSTSGTVPYAITTNFLNADASNNVYVSAYAVDSRGRKSATVSVTKAVTPYSPPKITAFKMQRCASNGADQSDGDYAEAIYSAEVSSLNAKNDKIYKLYQRVTGTTPWNLVLTLPNTNYVYTNANSTPVSSATANRYDFKLEVKDFFTTVSSEFSIPTAFVTMHFKTGGKSVGIGMISSSSRDSFEVGMTTDIIGDNVSTGRRFANKVTATVTDPNTVTQEWVLIDSHANLPAGGGYWYLHTIFYATASYKLQLAYGYVTREIYRRHCYNGTWTTWDRVFSTASLDLSTLIQTTGSQSRTGRLSVAGTDTSGSYGSAPIQIREVNNVGAAQYADNYAPYLSFHWGGRVAGAIMMSASGELCWRNQTNTTVSRIYHEGMSRSQTLYYPTFTTGWTNWGQGYQPVSYYKDAFNIIHLQGMAQSTSTAQYVFTLPTGWRPAYNHAYTVNYNGAQSNVYITSAGVVHHANASTSAGKWLSLDGICFEKGA